MQRCEESSKVPWKRANLTVNRFTKTAEIDISRLRQFKKNIIDFEKIGDQKSLKHEVQKAKQTIDQLYNNFQSLKGIRQQVRKDDLELCDSRLSQIQAWLEQEIKDFTEVDEDLLAYLSIDLRTVLSQGFYENSPASECMGQQSHEQTESKDETSQDGPQLQQLSAQLAVTESDEASVQSIAQDINDVKYMMSTLNNMVHEQGENVDTIEANVQTAHDNVKNAGFQLNKAAILKSTGFAVTGAVVGALVGGPVGLVAGAKVGMLAAGTGMAVGAAAGNSIKKMQRNKYEMELQNLNAAADMADTNNLRKGANGRISPSEESR